MKHFHSFAVLLLATGVAHAGSIWSKDVAGIGYGAERTEALQAAGVDLESKLAALVNSCVEVGRPEVRKDPKPNCQQDGAVWECARLGRVACHL